MTTVYSDLHHTCAALGTKLFTVTLHDAHAGLVRRAYSSNPAAYAVSGTKPIGADAFAEQVIVRGEPFLANRAEEFAPYFPDHAQIVALGCRSCLNLPILLGGKVLGTVNLLAEEAHFTPDRLARYQTALEQHRAALLAELALRPLG
jgi:GAF domain-containing protein